MNEKPHSCRVKNYIVRCCFDLYFGDENKNADWKMNISQKEKSATKYDWIVKACICTFLQRSL